MANVPRLDGNGCWPCPRVDHQGEGGTDCARWVDTHDEGVVLLVRRVQLMPRRADDEHVTVEHDRRVIDLKVGVGRRWIQLGDLTSSPAGSVPISMTHSSPPMWVALPARIVPPSAAGSTDDQNRAVAGRRRRSPSQIGARIRRVTLDVDTFGEDAGGDEFTGVDPGECIDAVRRGAGLLPLWVPHSVEPRHRWQGPILDDDQLFAVADHISSQIPG